MRPGIARIRHVFDYEVVGGSPLLGVRGAVIITHGRAKRRMIEHAVRVARHDGPRAGPGADRRGARATRRRREAEAPVASEAPVATEAAS